MGVCVYSISFKKKKKTVTKKKEIIARKRESEQKSTIVSHAENDAVDSSLQVRVGGKQ